MTDGCIYACSCYSYRSCGLGKVMKVIKNWEGNEVMKSLFDSCRK